MKQIKNYILQLLILVSIIGLTHCASSSHRQGEYSSILKFYSGGNEYKIMSYLSNNATGYNILIREENDKVIIKSIDKRLKQSANLICDVQQNKKKADDFLSGKEQIIKQGQKKNDVSFIEQGTAYITRKTNRGDLLLARLDDGDFIGKLPFLDLGQEPHQASVFASEDLELQPVGLEELQKEYNRLSATMKNFIENTSAIIATITQMAYELGDS